MNENIRDAFYNARNGLIDAVYSKLENDHDMYKSEIGYLNPSYVTEEVLADLLKNLLSDEKQKAKIVNAISKKLLVTYREKVKKEKAELAKNEKLWKLSGGKIPCIMECGFYRTVKKDDVLYGSNSFMCTECVKEHEDNWHNIFSQKSVYKIFGIK